MARLNVPPAVSSSEPRSRHESPLAPVPLPVLTGVALLAGVLTVLIALNIRNDWLAVLAFLAVLASASVALDRIGRAEAQRRPDPRYSARRLPREKSFLRSVAIAATLGITLITMTVTAAPDRRASPLPFLLAALFLYLVLPQLLALRIIRRSLSTK